MDVPSSEPSDGRMCSESHSNLPLDVKPSDVRMYLRTCKRAFNGVGTSVWIAGDSDVTYCRLIIKPKNTFFVVSNPVEKDNSNEVSYEDIHSISRGLSDSQLEIFKKNVSTVDVSFPIYVNVGSCINIQISREEMGLGLVFKTPTEARMAEFLLRYVWIASKKISENYEVHT